MEENIINSNKKIFSNNNNILLEVVNDLNKLINYTHDNLIIKSLGDSISKLNFVISENNKEIKYNDGSKYIGQVVNGLREGKGICNWFNGDKYEGDWKNNQRDGEGIYYYKREPFKGEKYIGYWKNNKREGKAIYHFNNGNKYEGDWKNDTIEGKGIF